MDFLCKRQGEGSAPLQLHGGWEDAGTEGHVGGHISIVLVATSYVSGPKATEAGRSLSSKDSKLSSNHLNRHTIRVDAPAHSDIGGIESLWD